MLFKELSLSVPMVEVADVCFHLISPTFEQTANFVPHGLIPPECRHPVKQRAEETVPTGKECDPRRAPLTAQLGVQLLALQLQRREAVPHHLAKSCGALPKAPGTLRNYLKHQNTSKYTKKYQNTFEYTKK